MLPFFQSLNVENGENKFHRPNNYLEDCYICSKTVSRGVSKRWPCLAPWIIQNISMPDFLLYLLEEYELLLYVF